jgi:sec-independent protein translocase protein TatB
VFDTNAHPFYDANRTQNGKLTRPYPTMLSIPHMIVVFLVVLVVFGPQKLPELARSFGKLMAEFRKASNDFKNAFEEEMRDLERQARIAELKKQVAEANAAANTAMAKTAASANPAPADGNGAVPTTEAVAGTANSSSEVPLISPVPESVPRLDVPSAEPASNAQGNASEPATPEPVEAATESSPSHDQQQPA